MIGAVAGLMTFLSALVLGLPIWTAYGVYAAQNARTLELRRGNFAFGPLAEVCGHLWMKRGAHSMSKRLLMSCITFSIGVEDA